MCGFINVPTVDSVVTVFLAHSSGDRLADDCLSRFCLQLGKIVESLMKMSDGGMLIYRAGCYLWPR